MTRTHWLARTVPITLLLSVSVHGQVDGLRTGECWWRNEGPFPCDQVEGSRAAELAIFRILDRETGLPIPGARCEMYSEHRFPAPTQWEPLFVAMADADGWVRIPKRTDEERRAWQHVKAPGYATVTDTEWEDVVTLARGVDLELDVVDPAGHPVPGARVGLIKGCGHTPDLTFGVTDERGRTWLRGLDPEGGDYGVEYELWIESLHGMGTESGGYLGLESPRPSPQRVQLTSSWSAIGRLRDARGEPLPDYLVGRFQGNHRGPWTRTDEEGRFALHGLPAYEDLWIVLDSDRRDVVNGRLPIEEEEGSRREDDVRYLTLGCPPPGRVIDLVLPAGDAWATVPVTVTLDLPAPIEPFSFTHAGTQVLAVESQTGFTGTAWIEPEERTVTLDLIPGEYTLFVDSEQHEPVDSSFRVRDEHPLALRVHPMRRPLVQVAFSQADRLWARRRGVSPTVTMRSANHERDITEDIEQGRPIHVSTQGPVVFHVSATLDLDWRNELACSYDVALDRRVVAPSDSVLLHGFRPEDLSRSYVAFRTVDEQGDPVDSEVSGGAEPLSESHLPAWMRACVPGGATHLLIATPDENGFVTFVVDPASTPDGEGLAPVLRRIYTPVGESRIVNLGDVVLPERSRRTLRVLGPDGREAVDWSVSFPELMSPDGAGPYWPDEGTAWPGARVEVTYGHDPFEDRVLEVDAQRCVLEGEGPWTVRLAPYLPPSFPLPILGWRVKPARFTVRVLDARGEPWADDFEVYFDAEEFSHDDADGVYRRLKLTPGWHRVFVTVPGRGAFGFSFHVNEEEARHFVVRA
ncbi:MAG: hypothetical protein H6834_14160 [Planctomycetes bacterium]|nr:hypothetical protein [Planctomycetota bacterium]